jgi:hypothetical protein
VIGALQSLCSARQARLTSVSDIWSLRFGTAYQHAASRAQYSRQMALCGSTGASLMDTSVVSPDFATTIDRVSVVGFCVALHAEHAHESATMAHRFSVRNPDSSRACRPA